MIRIANIVGARPQFIKCACVSRELRKHPDVSEVIVHTGQHYDHNMSEIFFRELEIPEPDINLGIGSGSHAIQTARMLTGLEKSLLEIKPDWVLVYGDTNSTLAAAVAAVKLKLRIAHVEAGLRSYNRNMPEEINRIVTDHVADRLFAPTRTAMNILAGEGLAPRSLFTGDVMYDSVLHSLNLAELKYSVQEVIPVDRYYLATVHRQENTAKPGRLEKIFTAFSRLDLPVVLPAHPRIRELLKSVKISNNVKIIEPLGYLQMLILLRQSEKVLTDSGGLQKEAFFLKKQCITLRNETEWTETLMDNWNIITDVEPDRILKALDMQVTGPQGNYFGDGHAAGRIVTSLIQE